MSLERWNDARTAAALLAVDPHRLGGAVLRARAGPVRDHICALIRALAGPEIPIRRVPPHITEDRLLGGLDLAATLRSGRVVVDRGILAEVNGGIAIVPGAERLEPRVRAHLSSTLDLGEVVLERDGIARRSPSRFAVLALDEGIDDERVSPALFDRLALFVDLDPIPPRWTEDDEPIWQGSDIARARFQLDRTFVDPALVEGLCRAAAQLGIDSCRVPIHALAVVRVSAALAGRTQAEAEDAELAARLVLGPRATRVPAPEEEQPEHESPPSEPPPESQDPESAPEADRLPPVSDLILAAAESAMPAGMLERLRAGRAGEGRNASPGPAGSVRRSNRRGRPAGIQAARKGQNERLNLVATLRTAAPWQKIRGSRGRPIQVRPEDFRVTRYQEKTETLTIFAVDASGSSALQRLGEAKGAVEQVLSECYVRRDSVALIGFRGVEADLILPPTRSLTRAKKTLAALPGGGATPLATGIDAARALAEDARRRGQTPVLVVMTDARANVARDGTQGRARAAEDALLAARSVKALGVSALFVDTAPRAQPAARQLAEAMDAIYLALPRIDAAGIAKCVRSAAVRAPG